MESLKPPQKKAFVLLWGVFGWGGITALVITFLDWHTNRHLTPLLVVARLAIFLCLGIFMGELMWNKREALARKKMARTQSILQFVLFVAVMLGLTYALWRMTHGEFLPHQ
jgi:hypothetical protein